MRFEESERWEEEKLRYSVLRIVYDRTEGSFERVVTGGELRNALGLPYEDIFRLVHFLEHNAFLNYLGAGPRVSLTPKGQLYIEEVAGRRRSIRRERARDPL